MNPPQINRRWRRLKYGHIIGIVDSYGCVRSEFTGDHVDHHAEHFPPCQCQWRWNQVVG